MGIIAIIRESLHIARTHKSLWLFGFLVGLGLGVNFRGDGAAPPTPPVAATPPDAALVLALIAVALACIVGFVILKFLSTGALIEGVRRARGNGTMTVREGFREGWAHWGVLLRIALLFAVAGAISVALLVGPVVLVFRAFGMPAVFFAGGLALLIGVPWLVTLYVWQAFAERIAVFENRAALDAITKARLFLHGRLPLGLKLAAAAFLGVLFVGVVALAAIAPVGALVAASTALWGLLGAILLGAATVLPLGIVAISIMGVVVSSVWTIGYLTEVEQ